MVKIIIGFAGKLFPVLPCLIIIIECQTTDGQTVVDARWMGIAGEVRVVAVSLFFAYQTTSESLLLVRQTRTQRAVSHFLEKRRRTPN